MRASCNAAAWCMDKMEISWRLMLPIPCRQMAAKAEITLCVCGTSFARLLVLTPTILRPSTIVPAIYICVNGVCPHPVTLYSCIYHLCNSTIEILCCFSGSSHSHLGVSVPVVPTNAFQDKRPFTKGQRHHICVTQVSYGF